MRGIIWVCISFLISLPSSEDPGSLVSVVSNPCSLNAIDMLWARVDFPDPSIPSMAIKMPLRRCGLSYLLYEISYNKIIIALDVKPVLSKISNFLRSISVDRLRMSAGTSYI